MPRHERCVVRTAEELGQLIPRLRTGNLAAMVDTLESVESKSAVMLFRCRGFWHLAVPFRCVGIDKGRAYGMMKTELDARDKAGVN